MWNHAFLNLNYFNATRMQCFNVIDATHVWISEGLVMSEEIVTLTVVMDQQKARGLFGKKASRYFWANFSCKGPH